MKILFNAYSLGSAKPVLAPAEMEIGGIPGTLGDLLRLCVEECVRRHNALRKPEDPDGPALGIGDIEGMARIGKVAFGIDYGADPADPAKAVGNALQSYEDGLYRVFLNGREIRGLDQPLEIREGDAFTFVRLVMLAGRNW